MKGVLRVTLQILLMPQQFDDVGDCVDAVLRRVGKRIVLALPLALGNPVPLVNEFYRRALRDRSIELKIFTGLRRATEGRRPRRGARDSRPLDGRRRVIERRHARAIATWCA
ncbi:hypothetical protein BH20PSE1_BH20PSE1_15100 [soil metagenome]